jgi:integrase
MPKVNLDAMFVRNAVCPENGKIDYYDKGITGFILEVRSTGGMTYHLRYRDQHGKQRQHKIGDAKSISFDKARSAAEKLRSRVVLGDSPIEEKKAKRMIPTIAEIYRDTYLPHLQNTRRGMGSDLSFWKVHLLPRFGSKHLDELTRQDVIDAQLSMRKAGYAVGTANKWIVQIRYMYNVAKKQAIPGSEFNPGAEVKQFTVEGRERFLSPEETERLREAVERSENTQLKWIVTLLLMLGCRKRELLDSKWEHFDLERRSWRIPISKSGKSRHVPLSTAAVAVLAQLPRWDGCPYVVPNPKSRQPFTGIHVSWDTARTRAGLPDVRMHDLRHTFASNLVNAGHSLFVVSKALGHTNTLMTQRYSHLSDETLFAAADAAANAMGASWTEVKQLPA